MVVGRLRASWVYLELPAWLALACVSKQACPGGHGCFLRWVWSVEAEVAQGARKLRREGVPLPEVCLVWGAALATWRSVARSSAAATAHSVLTSSWGLRVWSGWAELAATVIGDGCRTLNPTTQS